MDFQKEVQSSRVIYVKNEKPQSPLPPSFSYKNTKLNGTLQIYRTLNDGNFAERVRIGVGLRSLTKPRSANQWKEIVERKSPITQNRKGFTIDEAYWFGRGINWVIPTPIFGQTKVIITLEPSPLLASGFIIEIFRRDSTIVHEVQASTTFSAGCTVKFKVDWNLATNPVGASPLLRPLKWPTHQASTASLQSIYQQHYDTSSDSD